MTVVTQERKDIPLAQVRSSDYQQWLRNISKCYGTKKVIPLAICSLTEVDKLQIMPKEYSVVAVQVKWINKIFGMAICYS